MIVEKVADKVEEAAVVVVVLRLLLSSMTIDFTPRKTVRLCCQGIGITFVKLGIRERVLPLVETMRPTKG